VGGTGKTPCVTYLVNLLQYTYNVAVVSRGYKRITRGYRLATTHETAATIGDEAYQLYKQANQKKWRVSIAVGEDRAQAIAQLLQTHPTTQLILLDDGFQHRRVGRQINLLLTCFHRPFFKDRLFPRGQLREPRNQAQRADVVLVTKCPAHLSEENKHHFKINIERYCQKSIPIFFCQIVYGQPINLFGNTPLFTPMSAILLVTGIADPQPMVEYVQNKYKLVQHQPFPDHHLFSKKDITNILTNFHTIDYEKKCILTTEKDAMRLIQPAFTPLLQEFPIFFLPMSMRFNSEEERFAKFILDIINHNPF
jgi:tetraacyldisaccharide 4'-kinase